MREVFSYLGVPCAGHLANATGKRGNTKRGSHASFLHNMTKERKFQRDYDEHFKGNTVETAEFTIAKTIGKASEKAAIDKFSDFLIDNTTTNLKNTDLKNKNTGRLIEIKAMHSPCYSRTRLDANNRKTHIMLELFKYSKHKSGDKSKHVRRPGSLLRVLMQDFDAFVMFHIFEYDKLTDSERYQAVKEREDAKDHAKQNPNKKQKPIKYKFYPNANHWKIYRVKDFMWRLFALGIKDDEGIIKKGYEVVIELAKFADLELSDSEFRRLNA